MFEHLVLYLGHVSLDGVASDDVPLRKLEEMVDRILNVLDLPVLLLAGDACVDISTTLNLLLLRYDGTVRSSTRDTNLTDRVFLSTREGRECGSDTCISYFMERMMCRHDLA